MAFRVLGPKGHNIIKNATATRVAKALPALVKRFKKVSVTEAAKTAHPESVLRAKVVAWAKWGVKNEPSIHYRETRPMPLTAKLPLTTDCSGFVTLCYKLAGLPDPNGLNYNGTGYTGTLINKGKQVGHPQVGDIVVYGGGTGHHTAVVVEAGADPLTVSHGWEGGPLYIRVSAERVSQPAGVRYFSYI